MRKIAIIHPFHDNTAFGQFAIGFAAGFEQCGISTEILAMETPDFRDQLSHVMENPPDLLFSIAGRFTYRGDDLAALLEIPLFCYLIDLAIHYPDLMQNPHVTIGCIDRGDAELFNQSTTIRGAHFIPHGVNQSLLEWPDIEPIYPVTFIGKGFSHQKQQALWRDHFPKPLVDFMHDVADKLYNGFLSSYSTTILKLLVENGFHAHGYNAARRIEDYVRGKKRYDLLNALKGCEVHLFGDHWDNIPSHVIYHGPVSFKGSYKVIQQSRIVLNSSPTILQGGHERIFATMALSRVALTDANPYLQETFNEELLFYPPLKELPHAIHTLLANPSLCRHIGLAAHKTAHHHTWEMRAKSLIISHLNKY